jgi:signal transduction histidine kinase
MKRIDSLFGIQISLILFASLVLIWSAVFYDLQRSRETTLRESEVRTVIQAQVFAEYSRSTLKRINEFILNARTEWTGDWQSFSAYIKRAQENVDDLVFQVAIIDRDGIMAFSNLAKPSDRVDLSEREHFRVHKEASQSDRLFISRPLKGKVSGKWSIQVTRPILKNGQFNGVIVVSVSPDQFAAFAEKLGLTKGNVMTIVRNSGEIMARYPRNEKGLGIVLRDRPYLGEQPVLSGNYLQASSVDGEERIWGFSTLPEYGMAFVVGESMNTLMVGYESHRTAVLGVAGAVSLMAGILLFMLYRSLVAEGEMKQQLAEIFALSPDGFVSFDARRRIRYVSPAFCEMTGLEERELVGLDEAAFSTRLAQRCNANARFPGIAALRQTEKVGSGGMKSPEAVTATEESGGSHKRQRHHLIELSGAGQRVLDVGLRISPTTAVSQILFCRDVTHETEVDRMKSEFLSTAAHELRTPMASIFGFTELLLEQEFPPEDQRDFLATIHRQSELMIGIINELLDLARIEARRGKDFQITRLDLGELLAEVAAGFKVPAGREAPVQPRSATRCPVRVDRKKLTQAIGNILSNAYKYSPDGGAVEIELLPPGAESAERQPAQIGIRITDHGIGMLSEQRGRVCERFYRADTSGKIPGTGLGMSIVKEIIELHGGSIDIASQFGEGTQITLWLPLATSESAKVGAGDMKSPEAVTATEPRSLS